LFHHQGSTFRSGVGTSQAFLAALKRFNGRRGVARSIYCDNATNFAGAKNELRELKTTIYSDEARETITIHFIPEAAVKSAKHLLIRTVSTADLTYEELETVFIDIEAPHLPTFITRRG